MNIGKQHQAYYTATVQPEVVEVEQANYISLLGDGSPGTDIFYEKKRAIIQLTKVLQQHFKETDKAFENNIVEIFYWFDEDQVGYVDIGNFYTKVDLSLLHYQIAVRIPDAFTAADMEEIQLKKQDIPYANEVAYFSYKAGKSVQMLHKGPFAGELETLPILQDFATANGFKKIGMHHEIHLTPFEKGQSQTHLKTILRDPVTTID